MANNVFAILNSIANAMGKFVRVDIKQNLTAYQKATARGNIGAMAADASVLPEVTAADNDKILKVVDGSWAAAELPVYDGAYSVTPAVSEQTLETAQTFVDADIRIEKIPYSEVSNNSGGMTATIGGN